jgi:hypothetical protein
MGQKWPSQIASVNTAKRSGVSALGFFYFFLESLIDFFNAETRLNVGFLRAQRCRILMRAASFFRAALDRRKFSSDPFMYKSIMTGWM